MAVLAAVWVGAVGLDNGLGRRPPLGWSTWQTCGDAACSHDACNEAEIKAVATSKPAGAKTPKAGISAKTTKPPAAAGARSKSPTKKPAAKEDVDPAVAAAKAAEEAAAAEAAAAAAAAVQAKRNGKVVVRYNHYDKAFDVVDGKLNWEHVDDQYCISFVFKGNWTSYSFQLIVSEIFRH